MRFLATLISLLTFSKLVSNESAWDIPIVKCSRPSHYENILMTELRDKNTTTEKFREASNKLGAFLVNKVVECFAANPVAIVTPVSEFTGFSLPAHIELVSILRSGDALLESFLVHFPKAHVSKILIQRDESTAKPRFLYMKLSQTVADGHPVVITEPMLATGGSLTMAIELLKEKGVREENIFIASICTAPEGLKFLNEKYPSISVVTTAIDERLNEKKYIVPGLGDFGDRFYGTMNH